MKACNTYSSSAEAYMDDQTYAYPPRWYEWSAEDKAFYTEHVGWGGNLYTWELNQLPPEVQERLAEITKDWRKETDYDGCQESFELDMTEYIAPHMADAFAEWQRQFAKIFPGESMELFVVNDWRPARSAVRHVPEFNKLKNMVGWFSSNYPGYHNGWESDVWVDIPIELTLWTPIEWHFGHSQIDIYPALFTPAQPLTLRKAVGILGAGLVKQWPGPDGKKLPLLYTADLVEKHTYDRVDFEIKHVATGITNFHI